MQADSRICLFAYLRICGFADTQQTTCSILTPANKAALKALAIAEGGTTVVPNRACELSEGNIFSGEVMEECIVSTASMSSLRSVWALLRSKVHNYNDLHELTMFGLRTFLGNHEVLMHAFKKPVLMHKK